MERIVIQMGWTRLAARRFEQIVNSYLSQGWKVSSGAFNQRDGIAIFRAGYGRTGYIAHLVLIEKEPRP